MNKKRLGFATFLIGVSVFAACSSSSSGSGSDAGGSSSSSSSSSGGSGSNSGSSSGVVADAAADGGESLVGEWLFFDSGNGASLVLQFKADGTYQQDNSQSTASGVIDMRETGTYTVSGSSVTFTAVHWTCPGAPPAPSTSMFSLQNGNFILVIPQASLTFVPYTPDGGGGSSASTDGGSSVTFGCYPTDGGSFFASPFH